MPFGEYKDFADCVAKNSDKKDPKAYCGTIQAAAEGSQKIEEYTAKDFFDLTESEFMVEEGTGRMTANLRLIKSGLSKNNRNYRESALKTSADKGIFNGVRMFANHSTTPPLKRPISEMVAAIESTSWNADAKAVDGRVVFFNKEFYDFAQQAKGYMGDSINALVRGTRVRESSGRVTEDIHEIVQPHSVDFVIYPAAGGEILAFESEGDMIDWKAITAEDIKTNATELYDAIKAEALAAQPKPGVPSFTQEQIDQLVKDEVASAMEARQKEIDETNEKIRLANEKVVLAFAKSGLPEPTRKRVQLAFEGQTEFNESAVTEAITSAKEELTAVGAGPKITGQGPSSGSAPEKKTEFSINESVAAAFGMKPAKKEEVTA